MRFHVLTIFPEMIEGAVRCGVIGQALNEGLLRVETLNPRRFTTNVHQTIDDRPFGGGDGMVMMAEPLSLALEDIRARVGTGAPAIHLSPRGRPLTDARVRELAKEPELILIASRYGGVDQRFLNLEVDEEISIGDYVLSGGELPALVVIDAVARHLPGVLGNEISADEESFGPRGWLEHPQFTRPREWRGEAVPAPFLCGDHARIGAYKSALSILVTLELRPDLLLSRRFDPGRRALEEALRCLESMTPSERQVCGLPEEPAALMARLREMIEARPEEPTRRRRQQQQRQRQVKGRASKEGDGE